MRPSCHPTRHLVRLLALAVLLLGAGPILPAMAQFGVGFGVWGGNFGSWIQFWPRWRGYSEPARSTAPAVQKPATPAMRENGALEGRVTLHGLCPAGQRRTSCPPSPSKFSQVTVSATPNGGTQWIGSQPDAQGHYRLLLPPGHYTLTVSHPDIHTDNRVNYQVQIHPSQTTRQDLQIDLPAPGKARGDSTLN